MLKYLVNGMLIQIITLGIQKLVIYEKGEMGVINGAGGIWFCMLFKYCYYNYDGEIKFCCFAWKFKRGIYPYILLAVVMVLLFRLPLEMLVGLAYGGLQVLVEKKTVFPGACLTKVAGLFKVNSIDCWVRTRETN